MEADLVKLQELVTEKLAVEYELEQLKKKIFLIKKKLGINLYQEER